MKKFIICCSIASLSGCSTVMDIVGMQPFDNNEYGLIVDIRTKAIAGDCSKENVDGLYSDTQRLKNYTQYIPHNEKTNSMATDLSKIVEELHKKENPSNVYCKLKLNIVTKSAEEIQRVVGSKSR